ncbi:hypothetical protein BKA70DRAFT_681518 [Coprinopsis sp. MPI-PUGE-AT-0042]|nr:hypothetical protein BKA70DRAFT_681518 [Coprinopsis sp. MPI-PUGE-AT-0042]
MAELEAGARFFESLIGGGSFTCSTIAVTATVTPSSPLPPKKSLSHSLSTKTLRSIQSAIWSVFLPNLTAVNLTSDNVTLFFVSSWYLPAIRCVSLIASDFSYANDGFASIYDAREGSRIEELESGDSTSAIEEF